MDFLEYLGRYGNHLHGVVGEIIYTECAISYFSHLIEKYFGERIVGRSRQHVIVIAPPGCGKTYALNRFAGYLPTSSHIVRPTSLTTAVLHGTVTSGDFVPPIIKNDVVLVGELMNVVNNNDGVISDFLTSLEEGRIEVSRSKFVGNVAKIHDEAGDYGITITNATMRYKVDYVFWGATHNSGIMYSQDVNWQALEDRFHIIRIQTHNMENEEAFNVIRRKPVPSVEHKIRAYIEQVKHEILNMSVENINECIEHYIDITQEICRRNKITNVNMRELNTVVKRALIMNILETDEEIISNSILNVLSGHIDFIRQIPEKVAEIGNMYTETFSLEEVLR